MQESKIKKKMGFLKFKNAIVVEGDYVKNRLES